MDKLTFGLDDGLPILELRCRDDCPCNCDNCNKTSALNITLTSPNNFVL